jgi:ribosomal-protein-serine acetyltransferase
MPWCNADYSIADSDTWITLCQKNWQSGADRDFGIFDVNSGDLLGCVGINQINSTHNFGNLGYWVRASCAGRGVATNAARLAAQFGFRDLRLSRLEVVARIDNAASRRVAEKLGCQFECIARHRILFNGSSLDAALYSLLPHEIAG